MTRDLSASQWAAKLQETRDRVAAAGEALASAENAWRDAVISASLGEVPHSAATEARHAADALAIEIQGLNAALPKMRRWFSEAAAREAHEDRLAHLRQVLDSCHARIDLAREVEVASSALAAAYRRWNEAGQPMRDYIGREQLTMWQGSHDGDSLAMELERVGLWVELDPGRRVRGTFADRTSQPLSERELVVRLIPRIEDDLQLMERSAPK